MANQSPRNSLNLKDSKFSVPKQLPPIPYLIHWHLRWPWGLSSVGFCIALYGFTNQTSILSPRLLPLTVWDRMIPFLPWTIWIYLSGLFYLLFVFALQRSVDGVNRQIYSLVALNLLSNLLFIFFPTTYPRDSYPLPLGVDWLTQEVFTFYRGLESPRNCLPSLHVSLAWLNSLVCYHERRNYFFRVLPWPVCIILSTLTTKQHYLVDVVGGTGLALLFYSLFYRFRPSPQSIKRTFLDQGDAKVMESRS